jgi:hypothetical protein
MPPLATRQRIGHDVALEARLAQRENLFVDERVGGERVGGACRRREMQDLHGRFGCKPITRGRAVMPLSHSPNLCVTAEPVAYPVARPDRP